MNNHIYEEMIQPRGQAYKSENIKPYSHYREPVSHGSGRLAGNSRRWGDATPEVQSAVVDKIIEACDRKGLGARDTAYVLAIARVESGFNPDAAAGTTSAAGLGQFIDKTGKSYGLSNANRWDVNAQATALVEHYIENKQHARAKGKGEEYIYKYHHDGPSKDYGGLGLSNREVMPFVDKYEKFVRDHERMKTAGNPAATLSDKTQGEKVQAPAAAQSGAKGFDQAMKVMLPDAAGKSVHITGQYGTDRGDHKHGGVDFNYQGGQTGINMKHPQVHSPVSGKVEYCTGGSFGTVKIRDGQGHLHEILHLQSRANLQVGQAIHAGDVIGTMGGRGPKGANQYAQHVHYQIRDKNGKLVNPEAFWNGRSVEQAPPGANAPAKVQDAMADGTLRHGEKGPAVAHVQQMLAAVGYAGADGKPLPSTGNYLDNTHHAVRQFQRAHGLSETGVADRQTIDALKAAAREPLLTNDKHPDKPLYEQVKAKCDAQGGAQKLGLGSEREYKQALASIAFEAKVAGMARVDHVVPSTNGRTLIAMQVNPATGDQLRAVVDKQQAMQQPVEQSSYQLRQAEQQLQSQQKAQTQQQQTQQQNAPVQAR